MSADRYSLTLEQIAASIHGAGHVSVNHDGVVPTHFTPWVTERVMSPVFTILASAAGGARLQLDTSASRIEVTLTAGRVTYGGDAPPAPFATTSDGTVWEPTPIHQQLGLLLTVESDDSISERPGPTGSIVLERPAGTAGTAVDLYLPNDAAVTLHSISADAPIAPRASTPKRRWLHHGSSISQGGTLNDPLLPWPIQAARALDVELVNASLPGNCLLDPCVAEELAGLPAEVVSLELGINVANWDSHIARTFVPAVHNVLDQFHRADPSRQVVLISPLQCDMYEQHGGSLQMDEDGRLRPADPARKEALSLAAIRALLHRVVESRPLGSVVLVDGRRLLGPDDEHLLIDGLHPNSIGAALIARRFAELADEPGAELHLPFHPEPASPTLGTEHQTRGRS